MADDVPRNDLLNASVIVTGTHYSMTTLVGRLLAAAPEFHLLHEPANARPTLSYDSLDPENWYEFYDGERTQELAEFLVRAISANGLSGEILTRAGRIRSFGHALQMMRYIQRKLPMKIAPKPCVIKDPFLLFSAAGLQHTARMRVVLTIRHPCAFAESFVRVGNSFDFNSFQQKNLLQALPEEQANIARMVAEPRPLIEQAGLLWRIIYMFAHQYLVRNKRTLVVRQDEMVRETSPTIDRLFAFSGATRDDRVERMLGQSFSAGPADFHRRGSYIRRDGSATLEKWHDRLSGEEVRVIRDSCEEIAKQFGYGADSWERSVPSR